MTQGEFAKALGAPGSQSQVSLWEKGRVTPSLETLERIAKLVGWDVDAFLEWENLDSGSGTKLGPVLIEVVEGFSALLPQDEVLMVVQRLVSDLTDHNGLTDEDHAVWSGYLRGLGVIQRAGGDAPTPSPGDDADAADEGDDPGGSEGLGGGGGGAA